MPRLCTHLIQVTARLGRCLLCAQSWRHLSVSNPHFCVLFEKKFGGHKSLIYGATQTGLSFGLLMTSLLGLCFVEAYARIFWVTLEFLTCFISVCSFSPGLKVFVQIVFVFTHVLCLWIISRFYSRQWSEDPKHAILNANLRLLYLHHQMK